MWGETLTVLTTAQAGDLCVLLEPDADDHAGLLQRQLTLQKVYGGKIMQPVHLTCQRFRTEEDALGGLLLQLRRLACLVEPFAVETCAMLRVFSPYRRCYVLKWDVPVSAALRSFNAQLQQVLDKLRIESLYGRGWQSSWVTALEDVVPARDSAVAMAAQEPDRLFTARRLELSRILGPFSFETVALLDIGRREP